MNKKTDYNTLVRKYKERLKQEADSEFQGYSGKSREYKIFREESLPKKLSLYEKACNFSEKILSMKLKPENSEKLQTFIDIAHLDITPVGAVSFSIIFPAVFLLLGVLLALFSQSLFLVLFVFIAGLSFMYFANKIPEHIANSMRMKASNQMVLSIFYIVTYMRHTSNLENAIEFASEHLAPPLNLDFKKILWNVQTGVYDSVKESLDSYLIGWRKWNQEFVEMLLNNEANYGKEIVKNNLILCGGQIFMQIIKEVIDNGFDDKYSS